MSIWWDGLRNKLLKQLCKKCWKKKSPDLSSVSFSQLPQSRVSVRALIPVRQLPQIIIPKVEVSSSRHIQKQAYFQRRQVRSLTLITQRTMKAKPTNRLQGLVVRIVSWLCVLHAFELSPRGLPESFTHAWSYSRSLTGGYQAFWERMGSALG